MNELRVSFEERCKEVDVYIDFLVALETCAQSGPPRLVGAAQSISAEQQRILYSGVYLHLYNLVESTMTRCIEAIPSNAAQGGAWKPADLSDTMRREWVRAVARTHAELTAENRLEAALDLCETLVASLPVTDFALEKGGGGNWDDDAIEKFFDKRLGSQLVVTAPVRTAAKRHMKDDLGALALVKDLRNRLAHGSISFVECAENVTVSHLIEVRHGAVNYMKEVVDRFVSYIAGFEFLIAARRPAPV